MIEIDVKYIEDRVNGQLSGWPWGGKCVNVYRNRDGEWVAECKIPGHYSRGCDGYEGHFYHMEDTDCPVRQFMVEPWESGEIDGVCLHELEDGRRVDIF